MSKIGSAIHEIQYMDQMANKDQWVNRIHPLVKFVLTCLYIGIVVSFNKYDLIGLLGMTVYPICMFNLADVSFADSLKRLKVVLPLVCIVGIFNPFFDKIPVTYMGIATTTGILSMITLMVKGILTVLASYLLIATTTIEKICYGLSVIHVPQVLITQILLTYRYISLLLNEVHLITSAYSLRAPKQKGIHFKVWGTLTGQLLLRSMDRATVVYESMTLRGYEGNFSYMGRRVRFALSDIVYFVIWLGIFILCRKVPIIWLAGSILR